MGLTVLITNLDMDWPSGTVVYTRDLALELQRQGHRPIVYTWLPGSASRELTSAGIEVVNDLWRLRDRPDVIHGHHRPPAHGAMLRFPGVPAVIFCHHHSNPWDAPVPSPQIRRYFGVSNLCVQKLLDMGAPPERTSLRTNFVDLARFPLRSALPPRPARALVFSNYAEPHGYLPAVEAACRDQNIQLDVVGRGVGHVSKKPETLLGDYDLVFAKAKAAMEALAVGSAVVLCDFGGLGPMVTAADFDRLRPLNFGFAALLEEPTLEGIRRQIERYDRADARRVTELVRTHCGLEAAVRDLVDIYRLVIEEAAEDRLGRTATSAATAAPGEPTMSSSPRLAALRYRLAKAPFVVFYRAFGLGPRRIPGPLKLPYRVIRRVARRSVGVE